MAAAQRPSALLKTKTNKFPVNDRSQEVTAEDFQELGQILDDHATKIDSITGPASPNAFYGVHSTLAFLSAAYGVAVAGGYAVIDSGVGNDAKVALWDDNDNVWVLQETTATTTTSKFEANARVINVEVTDVNDDPYLILSGTLIDENEPLKLESYAPNAITRAL